MGFQMTLDIARFSTLVMTQQVCIKLHRVKNVGTKLQVIIKHPSLQNMTDFEAEYGTANTSLAQPVQDRFPKREPSFEDSDASVIAELDSSSDTDGDSDYVPPHMQRSDGDDASPASHDEASIKKEAESATSTELILGEAATKSAPGKRKTRPASREKRTSRGPTK